MLHFGSPRGNLGPPGAVRYADGTANRTAPPEDIVLARLREDIQTIFRRDPAARNLWEVLTYPGLHAVVLHRVAHRLWTTHWPPRSLWKTAARGVSQWSRFV